MNSEQNASHMRGFLRRFAILTFTLGACLSLAHAKDHKPNTSAAIKVVANMSFNQKPPADMLIRQVNGKSYLYVQLANQQGIVVVDVTRPDKLKVLSSMETEGTNQVAIHGNAAMLTTSGDGSKSSPGKSELVLLDISDPGNPRVVQRFSGVVRVLQDERNYTYVLNQDGLWVVSDKQTTATDDSWTPSIYG